MKKLMAVGLGLLMVNGANAMMFWQSQSITDSTLTPDVFKPSASGVSPAFDGAAVSLNSYYIALFDYLPTAAQLDALHTTDFTVGAPPLRTSTASTDMTGLLGNSDPGLFFEPFDYGASYNGKTVRWAMISSAPSALAGNAATPYAYFIGPNSVTMPSWTPGDPPSTADVTLSIATPSTVGSGNWTVVTAAVPEPGTATLGLVGFLGLLVRRMRQRAA